MRITQFFCGLSAVIFMLSACTKKETIIQEYNPPQPKLYGTWRALDGQPNNTNYVVFPNDGSNFLYVLDIDQYGFKSKGAMVYSATDKQLGFGGTYYNYKVSGDTLHLYSQPSPSQRYLRVNNPAISTSNWTNSFSIVKSMKAPRGTPNFGYSFAIDGDFLYPYGYNGMDAYIYKFNALTEQYVDSIAVSEQATTCFKSGTIYVGFYGNYNIWKFMSGVGSTISNNTINYVTSISVNGSSGTIYAFNTYGKLYSGFENSTFSELFDFTNYGCSNVLYYKNDEFICLKNGVVHRIKISPSFSVVASYEPFSNFNANSISTNGQDVWAFGYDYTDYTYKFIKLNLN